MVCGPYCTCTVVLQPRPSFLHGSLHKQGNRELLLVLLRPPVGKLLFPSPLVSVSEAICGTSIELRYFASIPPLYAKVLEWNVSGSYSNWVSSIRSQGHNRIVDLMHRSTATPLNLRAILSWIALDGRLETSSKTRKHRKSQNVSHF